MKQEDQEEPIVYKVQLLEELSERQQRLLRLANEIIDGKNQLIELYELETELYKKQNKRLTRSLFISAVLFALIIGINIARLLV